MKYETIIKTLFVRFPELNQIVDEEEKEFTSNLPYYAYETIFFKYIIVEACKHFDTVKIEEICIFLEEMAQCSDEDVNTLFGVAIIESLTCYPETLKVLRPFLKEKTLQELVLMENWKPKGKLTSEELEKAKIYMERLEPDVKKACDKICEYQANKNNKP